MFSDQKSVPLNHFPLWKYIMIILLLGAALLFALPNIFGMSPAVQVSLRGGKAISTELVAQVKDILNKSQLSYQQIHTDEYNIDIRLNKQSEQLPTREALADALGKEYVVALKLAPNTPTWLRAIGAEPMKLGLDLRGGMYFLLDIDMNTAIKNNMENYVGQLRKELRQNNLRYTGILFKTDTGIVIKTKDAQITQAMLTFVQKQFPNLTSQISAPNQLTLNLSPTETQQIKSNAVSQVVQVMRNRVNELGVAEASVTRSGADRVVIELPGVQDAARAREILGGTATLKFMLVDENTNPQIAMQSGNVPVGSKLFYRQNGAPIVLKNRVILSGKSVVGAQTGFDQQTGKPIVQVKLSGPEVSYFSKVTRENIGHLMATVLVNSRFTTQMIDGKEVKVTQTDEHVINDATIISQLGNNFQITGLTSREAQNLALMIRSGALPTPVQIVEEQQIGPTLGEKNIEMGEMSILVALIAVVVFMWAYYGLMGLIADIALVMNLVFIVAVMSILPGATLTLPGIAGIVLNLGMAIDANVLIFERIREELRNGVTVQTAIDAGYNRAFATIVDSNVTTLIVAVILFAVGTGAVKGFAVTLIIGIITSMFTALTGTRAVVNLIYGTRHVKRISIGI